VAFAAKYQARISRLFSAIGLIAKGESSFTVKSSKLGSAFGSWGTGSIPASTPSSFSSILPGPCSARVEAVLVMESIGVVGLEVWSESKSENLPLGEGGTKMQCSSRNSNAPGNEAVQEVQPAQPPVPGRGSFVLVAVHGTTQG